MGKKIDLTGQRFGKWTVLRDSGEKNSSGSKLWVCRCECGTVKKVISTSLRNGVSSSCGCLRIKDLSGRRFGRLTVVGLLNERRNGRRIWETICDCGKTSHVASHPLTSGLTTSCGCNRIIDLTGERYGKLEVIRMTDKRYDNGTVWECLCDCGRKKEVPSANLRSGGTSGCGECNYQNIVNKKFGRLFVISYTGTKSRDGKRICTCLCECGNIKEVTQGALMTGNTSSCGCVNIERMANQYGHNNPSYNPNLTDEERLMNRYQLHGINVNSWRRKVYSTDDYICQGCGNDTGGNLNAHHLNAWNAFPEQRFDTANGITLCKDCHKEYHHFNGYGDNTLEEFRDHLACTVGEEHILEIEETLLSRESEIIGQEQQTRELQTT